MRRRIHQQHEEYKTERERKAEIHRAYERDKGLPMRVVLDKELHFTENELGEQWLNWALRKDETAALAYLVRPELRTYELIDPEIAASNLFQALRQVFLRWPNTIGLRALEDHLELLKELRTPLVSLLHTLVGRSTTVSRRILENHPDLWGFRVGNGPSVLSLVFRYHKKLVDKAFELSETTSMAASADRGEFSILEDMVLSLAIPAEKLFNYPGVMLKPQLSGDLLIETALRMWGPKIASQTLTNHDLAFATSASGEPIAHVAVPWLRKEECGLIRDNLELASLRDPSGCSLLEKAMVEHDLGWEFIKDHPGLYGIENEKGESLLQVAARLDSSPLNKLKILRATLRSHPQQTTEKEVEPNKRRSSPRGLQ